MPRLDQILVRFSPLSFDPLLKMEGEQPLLDDPSQESVDLRGKHSLIHCLITLQIYPLLHTQLFLAYLAYSLFSERGGGGEETILLDL